MTAFAEDLRRYLGHQTISARPDTLAYRAVRFVRRYRVPVAAAALVIASLATGLYVANRQRALAELRNDRLRLMQAERMLDKDPTAVLAWLKTYQPMDASWPKVREIAADALSRGIARHVFRHGADVLAIAFTPDGAKLASCSEDRTVKLWEVSNGSLLRRMELEQPAVSLSISPDGTWLAAGGRDSIVHLWKLDNSESRELKGHQGAVNQVLFNPRGDILASAGNDGTIRFWNLRTGESDVLTGRAGRVMQVAFSPRGDQLASGLSDGSMHLWKWPFRSDEVYLGAHGSVEAIGFSRDGRWIAWAGIDDSVHVLDIDTGRQRSLEGHQASVSNVAFSEDSQWLATASLDKTIRLWNLSQQDSRILAGHENRVKDVAFSPDGRFLISASSDRSVRIWELATGESRSFIGHGGTTNKILFQPNSGGFATTSIDGSVRLWSLPTDQAQSRRTTTDSLFQLAISPDGAWVAGAGDHSVLAWNRKSGQVQSLQDPVEVGALAFSPNGNELFIGKRTGEIVAWNLATGERRRLVGHSEIVRALLPLKKSATLASASDDGTVRLCHAAR